MGRGRSLSVVAWVAVCLVALGRPAVADAQGGQPNTGVDSVLVSGVLREMLTGASVPGALVTLAPFDDRADAVWSGLSDERGAFRTTPLAQGTYEMTVEGGQSFADISHVLILAEGGIVDVWVEMAAVEYELPPIIVVARRVTKLEAGGFYRRREAGRGAFFTRDEIAELAPSQLSELFRRVPGARIIQGRSGSGNTIRLRGGCQPLFVLDGAVLSGFVVLDETFPINGVEGIEVYHGSSVPIEYSGMTTCGVVMLWSRDPSTGSGTPFTWTRLAVAIGLGGIIALLSGG